MDLCFQIVIVEGNTDKRGKVISIFPAHKAGTLEGDSYSFNDSISSPRTGFVFVRSVPENIALNRFLEPVFNLGIR